MDDKSEIQELANLHPAVACVLIVCVALVVAVLICQWFKTIRD